MFYDDKGDKRVESINTRCFKEVEWYPAHTSSVGFYFIFNRINDMRNH